MGMDNRGGSVFRPFRGGWFLSGDGILSNALDKVCAIAFGFAGNDSLF